MNTPDSNFVSHGTGFAGTVFSLDLENKLKDADKVSSKLVAVRGWINSILAQYIENPSPKSDWTETPYEAKETISDAFQKLWM